MSDEVVIYKGPGILTTLGVIFIVLKLVGVINWSWWWVTAPFWGPIVLIIGLAALLLFIAGIVGIFSLISYVWKD